MRDYKNNLEYLTIKQFEMCINLVNNNQFRLKLPDSQGRRYIEIAVNINNYFTELANNCATKEEAPLGVGCGGYHCCFVGGKYVILQDVHIIIIKSNSYV